MRIIKNGDVYDIGQTINGINNFLYLNNKWYYIVMLHMVDKNYKPVIYNYEYDHKDLTTTINSDDAYGYNECHHIYNIFLDNIEINSSNCPEAKMEILNYKIDKILNN